MGQDLRSMDMELAPFKPDFVTDLKKIAELSQKRSAENQAFAQLLETQDPAKLDEMAGQIAQDVASGIDCTQCANCCKSLIVAPDYRDVSALAAHFDMSGPDFKKKYLKRDVDGDMVMKQRPCPFLKNNGCSVYETRPQLCRDYPYLDKGNFIATLSRTLRNLHVCPIVFNSFELLKLKFS